MVNDLGLSIVVCTWNRAESLAMTLHSLKGQQGIYGRAIEILVVDNNSSDHTKQVVMDFASAWPLGTLRYEFEGRQGKQFALNHGIAKSRFDILAFTDDDILFADNWASEILKVFDRDNVELVGGKTLVVWPASGQPDWYHPSMRAVLGSVDLGDQRVFPAPADYAPAGANLAARRSLFERIGGFSESHFRHMDFEFGQRSAANKAKVSYEPSLVVYAPVDGRCLTRRYFRRWAFKAGIALDSHVPNNQALLLGAPRWVYRQFMSDLASLIFKPAGSTVADDFNRELRAWRCLGKIASAWHQKLRPSQHAIWIASFSQKKNNLY